MSKKQQQQSRKLLESGGVGNENFKHSDSSADTTASDLVKIRDEERVSLVKKASPVKKSNIKSDLVGIKSTGSLTEPANSTNEGQLRKEKKTVTLKSMENLKPSSTGANMNTSLSSEIISVKSSTTNGESGNGGRMFSCDYSLVVLVGSFFAYMLASLLSSCFGVFFENMESDLGWNKSKVAFIGGLISALQDLTGPISSALTNRFGCRRTAFFGGLIAALGMIGSAYVNEFWLLGFLMGGVTGFGSSLVLVSSVVVVTYYFEEKPSFAAGLTISGGSLGQSIFSLIIIKLNDTYGRSGCFLILGGILLNILVCAVLFRPLKWELEEDEDDEEDDEDDDDEDDDDEDEDDDQTDISDETANSSVKLKNSNANSSRNLLLAAPVARFDSSSLTGRPYGSQFLAQDDMDDTRQSWQGSDTHTMSAYLRTSSSKYKYMKAEKEFASDSCLPMANVHTVAEMVENNDDHSIASTVSLNSKYFTGSGVDGEDSREKADAKKRKRLLSNTSSISFSRCHSLELRSSHTDMNNNVKMNSSVPTSLESNRLLFDVDEPLIENDDQQDHQSKKDVVDFGTNDEYVVVTTDEIENCGSNLILSPDNTAIYLPDLFGDEPLVNEAHATNSQSNLQIHEINEQTGPELELEPLASAVDESKSLKTDDKSPVHETNKSSLKAKSTKTEPTKPSSNFISSLLNKFRTAKASPAPVTQPSTNVNINTNSNGKQAVQVHQAVGNIPLARPSINKKQNVAGNKFALTGKKIIKLDNDLYLIKDANLTGGKTTGLANKPPQKDFIIARCNCRQRYVQNVNKLTAKKANIKLAMESETTTRSGSTGVVTSSNVSKMDQQSFNKVSNSKSHPSKNPTGFHHYSNCPLFYLNLNRNAATQSTGPRFNNSHGHIVANANNTGITANNQHHHHHPHSSNTKASFYHIPNLFQNSYKFPLHFRNVYYYKSLLNLNMRIIVMRPHRAGALTITNQTNAANSNNVSLSCPDLNLRQFLIVNNKKEDRERGADAINQGSLNTNEPMKPYPAVLTIKDLKGNRQLANRIRRQFETDNLKSVSGARVLNAGSIVLLPTGSTSRLRADSINRDKLNLNGQNLKIKQLIKPTTGATKHKHAKPPALKLSDSSLSDYRDGIKDPAKEDDESSSSDEDEEEEDDDEEEDEDEDEDEEDEEECDNCFTRTKLGNYMYRYMYKPAVRPVKFVYYSMCENVKLFKLFKFCIFAFCNFILSFFYEAPFYFINSYMTENGSTSSQAGTVTVAVGIVSVFSSIVYGYIGDSKKVNPIVLYIVSLILCGFCCCLVPSFIHSYLITFSLMVLIGALISVSDVLVPIICVNIVGYDDFVNAYGLMFFCQGLASFSGPPVLGLIVDKTGTYSVSYYLIGAGICLSGVILTTIIIYDKLTKKKKTSLPNQKLDTISNKNGNVNSQLPII